MTGPISFSDVTAREQLLDHGEAVTFRREQRTTGNTWWNVGRGQHRRGYCHVEEIGEVTPTEEDLKPYREQSGFESVDDWKGAIGELNGGEPERGYLYRVVRTEDGGASDYDTTVVSYPAIPQALRETDQWVCWRREERTGADGEPYLTKIPVNPLNGSNASASDPSTWAEFERACEHDRHHEGITGIGFMFSHYDEFAGVDFDNAYDPEVVEWQPWAERALDDLDSYTEFSPSHTGAHTIVKAEKPGDRCKTGMPSELEAYDSSEVEIYDTERFFTVTGDHVAGEAEAVEKRSDAFEAVYRDAFESSDSGGDEGTTVDDSRAEEIAVNTIEDVKDAKTPTSAGGSTDLSDDEVIERAKSASNGDGFGALWDGSTIGYPSHSEARMALLCHLAFWTGRDRTQMDQLYRRSGLHSGGHVDKWERLGDDEIEKARGLVGDTYSGGSSGENGATGGDSGRATYMSARSGLVGDVDELGPLDAADVENAATEFGESHAEFLTEETSEVSATAGILSSVYRPFGKGDFEQLIEKGVRSASADAGGALTLTLDELLEDDLVDLVEERTTDHVQEATLRWEFEAADDDEDTVFIETSAVGDGKTHNHWRDFRDEIRSETGEQPPRPPAELRETTDWHEWINSFIASRAKRTKKEGPRTLAVEQLQRAIRRGSAYTENPGDAEAGVGYSERGGVFAPDGKDSEFILVPNETPHNVVQNRDIAMRSLQSELAARGHTVGGGGVSVVKRTEAGPRRFWKLDASFAEPREYVQNEADSGQRDHTDEVIEEHFGEAPGHGEGDVDRVIFDSEDEKVATDGGDE